MNSSNSDDPVKKIFGKTANEMFTEPAEPHSKFHSENAFCCNAGPEEMKHLHILLDALADDEITKLVEAVGITFGSPTNSIDRDTLEGVLDEADRENFYKEYHRLVNKT